MFRRFALATSLIVLPAIAMAQRGSRSRSDKRPEQSGQNQTPSGSTLRQRDIEDLNPLKLLIDKRKDLKLSDGIVASFKEAESKLKDRNAPSFKSVDSLLGELRSTGDDRAKGVSVRLNIATAIQDIQTNYDASAKDALAMLDQDQQAKANELLAKQHEEGEKNIRQRLVPGGRGGDSPRLD